MSKSEHLKAFRERVQEARKRRGFTQTQMAAALGMPQAKYHKYESRSYLPHDLVHRFCLITGVSIDWLFTGKELAPMKLETERRKRTARQKTGSTRAA